MSPAMGENTEYGFFCSLEQALSSSSLVCFPAALSGGGGAPHPSMAWEGVQAVSQCLSPPFMQHPPKELHCHVGHTLTTLSKSACVVASPSILSTFAQRDPKSPDCAVDDDDNDGNGEENKNDVEL